jgi:hypothetical protein
MSVHEHLDRFAGLPVIEFGQDAAPAPGEEVAWAVRTEYDGERFGQVFGRFLETVDTKAVTHLIFGYWGAGYETSSAGPVEMLAGAAGQFPELKALFLGDIIMEEDEISWITQSDVTPLLRAYPGLERLDVRGGNGLELSPLSTAALKVLRLESGGLPADVIRALGASDLPNLRTLDLWLGVQNYGGDRPGAVLLAGARTHGGLRCPVAT